MTDQELLELTAKALGGEFSPGTTKTRTGPTWETWEWTGQMGIVLDKRLHYPLTDNGDAFLLALALQLKIEYWPENDSVLCSLPGSMGATSVAAIGDVELRYAIVQAAAQKGLTL